MHNDKLVTLTIDDQTISVPAGTPVVDAVRKLGIQVPVFCYHPKLEPAGACRMCLVEAGTVMRDRETGEIQRDEDGNPRIRWFPKLQTACTLRAMDGLVVRTNTEAVIEARQEILEFLLTSHPLDCPICDKGGECPLQNLTLAHGPTVSRFDYADKMHLDKRVPLGDLIILDRERCILCGRCIRFQEEIAGDPVLAFFHRGRHAQVITHSDPPFDSIFSGNTTDICPVGALTSADFRFGARPWELTRTPSICPHCPVGCNLTLDTRLEGRRGVPVIKRVMPRQNEQVNEIWICDKGRFGHHHARAEDRLQTPLIRRDGELRPATWKEALDLVAQRLQEIKEAHGSEALGGVAGDRLSNEDLFLFQALLRQGLGTPHVDGYPAVAGAEGVARFGLPQESDFGRWGRGTTILVVAGDPHEAAPIWFLRVRGAVRRGARLIVANARATRLDRSAAHRLRYHYGTAPHLLAALLRALLVPEPRPEGEAVPVVGNPSLPGLETLRTRLAEQDGEELARQTGVAPEEVRAAAQAVAEAERLVILFGSEGMAPEATEALVQMAANLLIVTGHAGEPDSGLLPLWPHNNTQGAQDLGLCPVRLPGYRPVEEAGLGFTGMLAAARAGDLKGMLIAAADPVGDDPGTADALEKLDFLVVQELFLTETARRADVVLPALSFAEREGTYTSGDRRVQRFYQALPPLGEGRPDWQILTRLGRRLGLDWPYRTAEEVFQALVSAVPIYAGLSYERLAETEPQWPPVGREDLYFSGTAYQNEGGLGCRWPSLVEQDPTLARPAWVPLPVPPARPPETVPVRRLMRAGTLINRSTVLKPRLIDLRERPKEAVSPR